MSKPIKPTFIATVIRDGLPALRTTVTGRDAWMLLSLIVAGAAGITPITRPAPRMSHYTFKLRRAGFRVETIDEAHEGSFAGTHARYVLRDQVELDGGNLREYLASPEGQREFPGYGARRAA